VTTDVRTIFLDVQELNATPQGSKVVNAFMASAAEMFRTKRGHLAIGIRLDTFEKLRKQLRLELADGFDGLKLLSIAPTTPKA
jgi:hypothetical protein